MLEMAVKKRGMQNFLLHEVLSRGVFSAAWTSGTGPAESWRDELRNREDLQLATRFERVSVNHYSFGDVLRSSL